MNILAIDPGCEQSGIVQWEFQKIKDHRIERNHCVLTAIEGCVRMSDYPLLAIEKIESYGMAVGADVFETCVWTGRMIQAWIEAGGNDNRIVRIPRKDIKIHLCGTTKANDANVRQALIDRIGPPGTKAKPGPTYGIKSHEWAALAVAVVAYDRIKVGML